MLHVEAITQSAISHLTKHGYAIIDAFLPPSLCASLLRETDHLIQHKQATPNKTHTLTRKSRTSSPTTTVYEKPSVKQTEFPNIPSIYHSHTPSLHALHHDTTLRAHLNVHWPRLTLRSQSLKIQRADGPHASFPIHVDTTPMRDSRLITALLYPHNWPHKDGNIRLYPTPISSIDISPKSARLILLASSLLHHRVLPTTSPRTCLTLWLSGTLRSTTPKSPNFSSLSAGIAHHLLHPHLRDFSFRIAYEAEWLQSFREAHGKEEAQHLCEVFQHDLDLLRARLPHVVAKELALSPAERHVVADIVRTSCATKAAFEQLKHACNGHIPFFW